MPETVLPVPYQYQVTGKNSDLLSGVHYKYNTVLISYMSVLCDKKKSTKWNKAIKQESVVKESVA